MKVELLTSVFVPFERNGPRHWVKRDDLPRFLTSKEVIRYLAVWGRKVSYRNGHPIPLEWREHSEPDLIKEFTQGVGTLDFKQKRRRG
jgi:hypothetical protein